MRATPPRAALRSTRRRDAADLRQIMAPFTSSPFIRWP
jgi:hypothetical protein